MKNKNTEQYKKSPKGNIKTVIITIVSAITVTALVALYLAFPQISANQKFKKIYGIIEGGAYDYIVLSNPRPYESGSFEQVTEGFEMILDGKNKADFKEAFLKSCKGVSSSGSTVQETGFWDMKVIISAKDERFIFYIDGNGIYLTDMYKRFNFEVNDSSLLDTVKRIQDEYYK